MDALCGSPKDQYATRCSGVSPCLFCASGFAPFFSRSWTVSVRPICAASCSGVSPWLFCASGFAPAPSRKLTVCVFPFLAAICRAVPRSGDRTSALNRVSSCSSSLSDTSPFPAASCKSFHCRESGCLDRDFGCIFPSVVYLSRGCFFCRLSRLSLIITFLNYWIDIPPSRYAETWSWKNPRLIGCCSIWVLPIGHMSRMPLKQPKKNVT